MPDQNHPDPNHYGLKILVGTVLVCGIVVLVLFVVIFAMADLN